MWSWAFLVEETRCADFDSLEQNSWTAYSSTVQVVLYLKCISATDLLDTLNFPENNLGRKQEET